MDLHLTFADTLEDLFNEQHLLKLLFWYWTSDIVEIELETEGILDQCIRININRTVMFECENGNLSVKWNREQNLATVRFNIQQSVKLYLTISGDITHLNFWELSGVKNMRITKLISGMSMLESTWYIPSVEGIVCYLPHLTHGYRSFRNTDIERNFRAIVNATRDNAEFMDWRK